MTLLKRLSGYREYSNVYRKKMIDERRGNTSELIEHMLQERQQLLALLLQTSNVECDSTADSDRELLNEFCQVLVDYIAAGHFGLYERIVNKKERRKSVAELALRVYPKIDKTTQVALSFNEKYDADKEDVDLSRLPQELSVMGEELANRIELEDQLINELLIQVEVV